MGLVFVLEWVSCLQAENFMCIPIRCYLIGYSRQISSGWYIFFYSLWIGHVLIWLNNMGKLNKRSNHVFYEVIDKPSDRKGQRQRPWIRRGFLFTMGYGTIIQSCFGVWSFAQLQVRHHHFVTQPTFPLCCHQDCFGRLPEVSWFLKIG